jgi:Tfp pilus assembly protein PilW
MRTIAQPPRCNTKAFTVVEVMIATTICLLVVTSAIAITLQFLKTYQYEENRLTMNHDIRHFTEQMTDDAAHANCFYIYPNFGSVTVGGADTAINAGAEGDYLVLVTTGYNQVTGATTVTKVVGYYRNIYNAGSNYGTVYRYSFDYGSPGLPWVTPFCTWLASTGNIVPSILGTSQTPSPAIAATSTHKLFEPTVIGDPTQGVTGQLFYNFNITGVMVKAEVQDQSNPNQVKVIDTYNLTIAPHG